MTRSIMWCAVLLGGLARFAAADVPRAEMAAALREQIDAHPAPARLPLVASRGIPASVGAPRNGNGNGNATAHAAAETASDGNNGGGASANGLAHQAAAAANSAAGQAQAAAAKARPHGHSAH